MADFKFNSGFPQVTIVGVGLLGASLGLALKERKMVERVVGVGRAGSNSLKTALERNAIDAATEDVAAGIKGSSLVVLCTPVRQFPEMMKRMKPGLEDGKIITDVGSTKAQVMAWAKELVPNGSVFVGSHPMAGSEKRGPEAARANLYEGALCLICQPWHAPKRGLLAKTTADLNTLTPAGRIEAMWRGVGMRTLRLKPQEHDDWVANVSHLVHAAAFSLVQTIHQKPETLQAAAGGYFDTTRVAASDVEMWTDIFLTNAKAVSKAINRYVKTLRELQQAVTTQNEPAIRKHLTDAKRLRDEATDWRKKGRE